MLPPHKDLPQRLFQLQGFPKRPKRPAKKKNNVYVTVPLENWENVSQNKPYLCKIRRVFAVSMIVKVIAFYFFIPHINSFLPG